MRQKIKTALEMKYKGEIAEADANLHVYLDNPAGIGEHPEVIAAIDTQIEKIAEAEDKLGTVNANLVVPIPPKVV
jgi:hypothetical protein